MHRRVEYDEPIDAYIVDIVELMNEHDYPTFTSCSGLPQDHRSRDKDMMEPYLCFKWSVTKNDRRLQALLWACYRAGMDLSARTGTSVCIDHNEGKTGWDNVRREFKRLCSGNYPKPPSPIPYVPDEVQIVKKTRGYYYGVMFVKLPSARSTWAKKYGIVAEWPFNEYGVTLKELDQPHPLKCWNKMIKNILWLQKRMSEDYEEVPLNW